MRLPHTTRPRGHWLRPSLCKRNCLGTAALEAESFEYYGVGTPRAVSRELTTV